MYYHVIATTLFKYAFPKTGSDVIKLRKIAFLIK